MGSLDVCTASHQRQATAWRQLGSLFRVLAIDQRVGLVEQLLQRYGPRFEGLLDSAIDCNLFANGIGLAGTDCVVIA